ncbi:hypothetical protein ACFLIM_25955 [Nonomuraea sp. M3C6]|uniref:Uncharacterized protein n=1 Tax=Nonomuraea marmarensis TaxID=3351344 RepID=A0ABW7AH15_9ACTN
MVNTAASEVRETGPWIIAGNSQGNCVAARQLACFKSVHVCELSNPEHFAEVSPEAWARFLNALRTNEYQPKTFGNLVMFTIDEPRKQPKPIITTLVNWQLFTYAVGKGHFDKLPPVEIGGSHGKWLSTESVV